MKKMLSLILAMVMAASTAVMSVSASEELTPVGYWSFDNIKDIGNEAEGSTWAKPEVGSGVTAVSGLTGSSSEKALYFDNTSNSYVNLGLVPGTLAGKSEFTVAGWIKVTPNADYNDIFSIYSGDSAIFNFRTEWHILQAYSHGYEACRVGLDTDTWKHVAVSVKMDSGAWKVHMYVNGTEWGTNEGFGIALGSIPADAVAYIGAGPNGGNPFSGAIDEMRIFDSVLTAEQIGALRTSDLAGKLPSSVDKIENLSGHWTLDSTAVTDKSNSGWGAATVGSALTPTVGKINKALSFDNTANSYINLGTVPASVAGKNEFTVSGWINVSYNMDYNDIFSIYSGDSEVFKLRTEWHILQAYSYGYEACREALDTGVWKHVAISVKMDSRAWKVHMYVNGTEYGTNEGFDIALDSIPADAVAYIGAGPDGINPFIGAIDDMKFYTRALQAGEIKMLANDYPHDSSSNLAAKWTFENGSAECVDGILADDWATPVIGGDVKANTPGFSGSAVEFVKNSPLKNDENYIDLGNIPELLNGNSQITMSAWIRPTNNNYYMTIFSMVNESGNPVWALEDTNGVLAVKATYEKYPAAAFTGIPEKEWTHVAVSIQFAQASWSVKTYVNGELKGETNGWSISDSSVSKNWKLYLGASRFADGGNAGNTDDFNGKIDDVRLYNTILSDEQVKSIYSETSIAPSYANDSELSMLNLYSLDDNSFTITVENGFSADISGEFSENDTADGIFNKNGVYIDNIPQGLYVIGISAADNTVTVAFGGETEEDIDSDKGMRFTLLDSATAEGYANTKTHDINIRSIFDLWVSDYKAENGTISGHIKNARYEGGSADLYIAAYNADGKLINICKAEYTIPQKGDYGAEFKAEIGEYYSAKIFMWDGANAPLLLPKEV